MVAPLFARIAAKKAYKMRRRKPPGEATSRKKRAMRRRSDEAIAKQKEVVKRQRPAQKKAAEESAKKNTLDPVVRDILKKNDKERRAQNAKLATAGKHVAAETVVTGGALVAYDKHKDSKRNKMAEKMYEKPYIGLTQEQKARVNVQLEEKE